MMDSDRANHLDAPQDNADEQSYENQYSPAATEPVWSQEYPCRPVWRRNGGTRGDLVFTDRSRLHLVKLAQAHNVTPRAKPLADERSRAFGLQVSVNVHNLKSRA